MLLLSLLLTVLTLTSLAPASQVPLLSRRLNVVGKLEVLQSDNFETGESRRYTLLRHGNMTYNVHVADEKSLLMVEQLQSGVHVQVKGDLVENLTRGGIVTHGDLHVQEIKQVSRLVENSEEVSFHRLAMFLINLGKYEVECTATFMQSVVEGPSGWPGGLIGLTERNLYSLLTYSDDIFADQSVDIFGPYNVKYDDSCDPDGWASATIDMAKAQGVDVTMYQHRAFVLPGVDAVWGTCGWHGLGNVGCGVCDIWVADCGTVEVFLHELGHNLGLPHAGSNWFQAGTLVEYGDPTSVMGNGWWYTNKEVTWYNLPELEYLVNKTGNNIDVPYVHESGIWQIGSFNILPQNSNYSQGIKVYNPATGHLFYFSFNSNSSANYANTVLVHEYYGSPAPPCYIVKTLNVGETFQDNKNVLAVTVIDFDNITFTLNVQYGCVPQSTVTRLISHTDAGNFDVSNLMTTQITGEGSSHFTLQVFNMDPPICTPTTYNFSSFAPNGWEFTFFPPSLYLVPGQNCSVGISVTTPDSYIGNETIWIGAAADSGFFSPLHDISMDLNVSVGPLSCIAQDPSIWLSPAVPPYVKDVVQYEVIIVNNDMFACEPTEFTFNVDIPHEWKTEQTSFSVSISAGTQTSVLLQFSPTKDTASAGNFAVAVLSTRTPPLNLTGSVPSMTKGCVGHTPHVQLLSPAIQMETRDADSVLVYVANRDSLACEGATFFVSVLDPPSKSIVRTSVNPPTMYLLPGEGAYFYLTLAVPIYQTMYNLSLSIGVQKMGDGLAYDATDYLDLTVTPPPCIPDMYLGISCDDKQDLASGWIACFGWLDQCWGPNCWNCPFVNVEVHATLPDGWSLDWINGHSFVYDPLNYTIFNLNFTVPANLTAGSYTFSLYGGESGNETSMSFSNSQGVSTCDSVPFTFEFVDSGSTKFTLAQGESTNFHFWVRNGDSSWCEDQLYSVVVGQGDMKGLFSFAGPSPSFSLSHGASIDLYLSLVAGVNLNISRSYSFNITVTNTKTNYTSSLYYNISVDLNCTYNPPQLTLTPLDNYTALPGDATSGLYTLNVTNMDAPLCPSSQFTASLRGSNDNLRSPQSRTFTLSPNETFITNFTLGVNANTAPGIYTITASTSDSKSNRHSASTLSTYTMGCPVPRPVFNLSSSQYTPFLKTKTAVSLTWNACDSPVWCCCPCTWEIIRDGEVIGTSSTVNFTDFDRPAGSTNTYTVNTIDKNKVKSPTVTTCTVTVDVDVRPPDLTKLYIFIALVIMSSFWIAGCGFLMYLFRKSVHDRVHNDKALLGNTEVNGFADDEIEKGPDFSKERHESKQTEDEQEEAIGPDFGAIADAISK